MWILDEAWLRRGSGCGGSVVSGQTRAMSLVCSGHVSDHPTVSECSLSRPGASSQEECLHHIRGTMPLARGPVLCLYP